MTLKLSFEADSSSLPSLSTISALRPKIRKSPFSARRPGLSASEVDLGYLLPCLVEEIPGQGSGNTRNGAAVARQDTCPGLVDSC